MTDRSGDVPRAALGEAYDRSSDLGIAVADVLRAAGHAPPPETSPTLPEVAAAFAEIEQASGPARKSAILRALLERADPLTAKYIVKVLGGDLRIGLREGLVEAAIARAFDRPLDDVKWAGMLIGDVGRLAALARDDAPRRAPRWRSSTRSSSCSPRRPRTPPRSSPGSAPRSGSRTSTTASGRSSTSAAREVRLYSRDLHDISAGYPGDRRGGRRRCLGRHPRRRDPRLARRDGAAVHRAPGAARAEDAVGRDPGRGPGHLRRLRRARARAGRRRRRSSRCCASR